MGTLKGHFVSGITIKSMLIIVPCFVYSSDRLFLVLNVEYKPSKIYYIVSGLGLSLAILFVVIVLVLCSRRTYNQI